MSQLEPFRNVPRDEPPGKSVPVVRPSTKPAALSATPGMLCLLKAFRRRWPLALGLGLLMAGLVGTATFTLVPRAKYIASATLHVSTKPKRIMFDPQERETDYKTYQKTQVALLKNRKVLANALAKPELAGLETLKQAIDADEWLDQNLKADFPGGSEVLQVSLSGDRPEDLSKIVNAVVKSYMTVIVEEEYRERVARLDALRKLREKYESELKLKRKSLRETVAAVGLTDQKALAMSQQFKVEHLGLAQRELMRARSEQLKAQSEATVLADSPLAATSAIQGDATGQTSEEPGGDPDQVERDPRVQALRAKEEEYRLRRRDVERIARDPSDPSVTRIQSRHADALKRLDEVRRKVGSELARTAGSSLGISSNSAGLSNSARARAQVDVWRVYGEALEKDVQRLQGEVKDTTDKGLDLENEREEIAIATEISRKVGSEVEAVQVELGAPDRIQLMAQAKVPNKKDELKKLKAGGAAAFGAFACALLGVAFMEYRTRRIDAPEEVVDGLGLRLVGTLPARPGRSRPSAAAEQQRRWEGGLVSSVDAMRAILLHGSRVDGTRVIMVASALKGEGKTSLSCLLAESLARSGRKTLLIDGDLRSPACHRLFDLPAGPGLCEVLRGEIDVESAIQPASDQGSLLLTAGRVDAASLQSLSMDGLVTLLGQLRLNYDFIVVDSSPILPVADSLLVAQAVDAVIFSVMRSVSRLSMVHEAHERISVLGVRTIGAVVSGIQSNTERYEYSAHSLA